MNPTTYTQSRAVVSAPVKATAPATTNFWSDTISGPLGDMFALTLGKFSRNVAKIEENTFEIFNGKTSAIVDGDHLFNLVTGKQSMQTLKFQ